MKSLILEAIRLLIVINAEIIGSVGSDSLPISNQSKKGVFVEELNPQLLDVAKTSFKWWSVLGSSQITNSILAIGIILLVVIIKELRTGKRKDTPLKVEKAQEEAPEVENTEIESYELQEVVCGEVASFEFEVSGETEVKVSALNSPPSNSRDPPPAYEEVDPHRIERQRIRPTASARNSPNRFARNLFNEPIHRADSDNEEPVIVDILTGGINNAPFLSQPPGSGEVSLVERESNEQRLRLEYDRRLREAEMRAEQQRQREVAELRRQINNQRIASQLERSQWNDQMEAIREELRRMREQSSQGSQPSHHSCQRDSPEVVPLFKRRATPPRTSSPPLIQLMSPIRPQTPPRQTQQIGSTNPGQVNPSSNVPAGMIDAQVAFRLIDSFKDIAKQLAPKEDRPVNDKQRIEKFYGDKEEALEWLEEYERIASSNRWNGQLKLSNVPGYLRKAAKQWFESRKSYCSTWEEFVEEFTERFLPKDNKYKYLNDFSTAQRKPKETASEFIDRVLNLKERTKMEINEEQVIVVIKRGINNKHYRHQISTMTSLRQVISKVQSLEEYDSEDEDEEPEETQNRKQRDRSPEAKVRNYGSEELRRDNMKDRTRQVERSDFRRPPQQFQQRPPQYPQRPSNNNGFRSECANCGKMGHSYNYCKLPIDQQKVDNYLKALHELRANARALPIGFQIKTRPTTQSTMVSEESTEDLIPYEPIPSTSTSRQ